jgi:hypothetical protein
MVERYLWTELRPSCDYERAPHPTVQLSSQQVLSYSGETTDIIAPRTIMPPNPAPQPNSLVQTETQLISEEGLDLLLVLTSTLRNTMPKKTCLKPWFVLCSAESSHPDTSHFHVHASLALASSPSRSLFYHLNVNASRFTFVIFGSFLIKAN